MLNISTEVIMEGKSTDVQRQKARSLKRYLLEKMRDWINGLLEAERDEFLGRGRYQMLDEHHDNYRNGYRTRKINLFGLGALELRVPRDRKGEFQSELLPEGKSQDAELEAFLAEVFLAGCSTRDLERISGKHLGQKYDSKQISRMVARATRELEAWRGRQLEGRPYKFVYLDGANFQVRINQQVAKQSFCAVLGVSEEAECFEVLALEMGDRERSELWESIFVSLAERGLNREAVELGVIGRTAGSGSCLPPFLSPGPDAALSETRQGQRLPEGEETRAGGILQGCEQDLLRPQ